MIEGLVDLIAGSFGLVGMFLSVCYVARVFHFLLLVFFFLFFRCYSCCCSYSNSSNQPFFVLLWRGIFEYRIENENNYLSVMHSTYWTLAGWLVLNVAVSLLCWLVDWRWWIWEMCMLALGYFVFIIGRKYANNCCKSVSVVI